MQGGVEFKTEIELLSRVHHKNLVCLLGFCFEKGEEMLIYEYVPNGNLKDTLTGIPLIEFCTLTPDFLKLFYTHVCPNRTKDNKFHILQIS